jgi:hypothetical protein
MKIEMGESLFLSWLRHVKQCQIVQLNWKPSNSWDLTNEGRIADLLRNFRDFFESKCQRELFGTKSGQSINQILRQGEIDALGFELKNRVVISAYAIDVAFHEGGLIYGTLEETVCRVVKKLVRTAMILLGYFDVDQGEIIFASPKISPQTFTRLEEMFQEISDIAKDSNLKFQFRLFGNQSFADDIVAPVIRLSDTVADTSELFMRSIQLYHLCGKDGINRRYNKRVLSNITEAPVSDEIKIGQLVKATFSQLFSQKKLTQEMLYKLQDAEYSRKEFGLSFPALKRIKDNQPEHEQRLDPRGRARYWSSEFGDDRYFVCSQWFEKHRKKFMQWASQFD